MLRLIQDITEFIFIDDHPEVCDLIIVPGSDQSAHVETAAKMFKAGYGNKIMVCGRYSYVHGRFKSENTFDTPYEGIYETEASFYKQILLKNGVPEGVILSEDCSTNTFENAIFAQKMAHDYRIETASIMLCCQAFHARRALMTFERYFQNTRFIVVPTVTQGIDRESWYRTPKAFKMVMGEVEKCGAFFNDMYSLIPGNNE